MSTGDACHVYPVKLFVLKEGPDVRAPLYNDKMDERFETNFGRCPWSQVMVFSLPYLLAQHLLKTKMYQ